MNKAEALGSQENRREPSEESKKMVADYNNSDASGMMQQADDQSEMSGMMQVVDNDNSEITIGDLGTN